MFFASQQLKSDSAVCRAADRCHKITETFPENQHAFLCLFFSETSEKYLVRLHRRLIRCLQAYHRTQAQWEGVVIKALHLEDEIANLDNSQREFVRSNRELKLYLSPTTLFLFLIRT